MRFVLCFPSEDCLGFRKGDVSFVDKLLDQTLKELALLLRCQFALDLSHKLRPTFTKLSADHLIPFACIGDVPNGTTLAIAVGERRSDKATCR